MVDTSNFVRLGSKNMVLPPEGPKLYPVQLDFRTTNTQVADFISEIQKGFISFLQGGFFDNSLNNNPLFITTDQVNQVVQIPAFTMGYMPLFITDSAKLTFTTVQAGNLVVPIVLTNVPVTPYLWSVA
jgi:hypothetical protein